VKTHATIVLLAATLGGVLARAALLPRESGEASLSEGAPSAQAEQEERELAGLDGRIDALASEVASLRAARPRTVATPDPGLETPPRSERDSPRDSREVELADEDNRRAAMDQAEATFRQEARDGAWAAAAETVIQNVGRTAERTLPILAAECHTSTCRVELADADPEHAWFEPFALATAQGDFQNVLIDQGFDPNGRPISILYMSRRRQAQN
jgi:hypothetical protein